MKKKEEILTLIAEIQDELKSIGVLTKAIEVLRIKIGKARKEKEYLVESAALKLQNFFTAVERIFEKIAGDVNGGLPTTLDWHSRLLKVMTLEIPEVRPPVITHNLEKKLLEYLRFRHLARSIYGFELDVERMEALLSDISRVSLQLKKEIEGFIGFLKILEARI